MQDEFRKRGVQTHFQAVGFVEPEGFEERSQRHSHDEEREEGKRDGCSQEDAHKVGLAELSVLKSPLVGET